MSRTIAKALRVTKFDSVSTLLADYTGRKIAATARDGHDKDTAGSATATPSSQSKGRRRAATAAPASGGRDTRSRTSAKRGRPNNDNAFGKTGGNPDVTKVARGPTATGAEREIIPECYPSGKLEEDRNPPLFASSTRGGRKMVSLMTGGATGKKDPPGHDGTRRRAKTAGMPSRGQHAGERGSALKGLAIRDLTPPGFILPAAATTVSGDEGSKAVMTAAAATAAESGGGGGTDGAVPGAVPSDGVLGDAELAAGGGEAASASGGGTRQEQAKRVGPDAQKAKEICFNCWSKGSGKTCALHGSQAAGVGKGPGGGGGGGDGGGGGSGTKADGEARVAESALMCKNWDVGVMRRRYRSEELQVGYRS